MSWNIRNRTGLGLLGLFIAGCVCVSDVAAQGLTLRERIELREEGLSPAEINEYNQEMIREQNGTLTPEERRELRDQGYTPAEIEEARKGWQAEARASRQSELLESRYERGLVSDAEYDRQLTQIEKRAYSEAYGPIVGAQMWKELAEQGGDDSRIGIDRSQFLNGLRQEFEQGGSLTSEQQQRLSRLSSDSTSGDIGLNQARFERDYVINGDKPLDAEVGIRPKVNSLFPDKAQWLDDADTQKLANRVTLELARDLAALRDAMPEEASLANANALAERLKGDGKDAALVANLIGALGDGDLRRLERNAELLGVAKQEVARFSLTIAIDDLTSKFEEDAASEEMRRLSLQAVRYARTANLEGESAQAVIDWLTKLPELLDLRQALAEVAKTKPTGEPQWPSGAVDVVLDPDWDIGQCRVLPNGWLICGARDVARRIVREKADFRLAFGLPVFTSTIGATAQAASNGPAANNKPMKDFVIVSGAADLKSPARYTLRRFRLNGPSWELDEATAAWPEYSIPAGRKQTLAIQQDGFENYVIEFLPSSGAAPKQLFLQKNQRGANDRFELRTDGDGKLGLKRVPETCFLDNSRNANPFHYMIGEEHKTIRPGAIEEFATSVTIRYCEKADDKSETFVVLKEKETGYVGLTVGNHWLIATSPEWSELDRSFASLELPRAVSGGSTELPVIDSTPTIKGTLHIVSVGLSNYRNPTTFPTLKAARYDAEAFVESMKAQTGLYKEVQSTLLLNEKATAYEVRKVLTSLNRKVTKNDVVVVFLSGHGKMQDGTWFFCPHDAVVKGDNKLDMNRAIASTELQRVTSELRCKHACVMLDSCFSGGATDGFRELITKQGRSGIVVFASSTGTEESEESGNRGAFTKSLLDTLTDSAADGNRDNYLEVVELDDAIANRVKDLTGGRQHFQAEYSANSGGFKLIRLNPGG